MIGCFSDGQMEKRVNDFPMKDMASARTPLHMLDRKRDAPVSSHQLFIYIYELDGYYYYYW